jgi:flavin-binding protein dodecin
MPVCLGRVVDRQRDPPKRTILEANHHEGHGSHGTARGDEIEPAVWWWKPPQILELKESVMAVARVTEISSTSPNGFDDAIKKGIERATKTLRNVKSAWVKEQRVDIDNGKVVDYQVNLLVTFVLED